jgi:hypothetical protein
MLVILGVAGAAVSAMAAEAAVRRRRLDRMPIVAVDLVLLKLWFCGGRRKR